MKFSKYHGTGNDFIVIEDHAASFSPKQIKRLCDRRYGIGGDGLILIREDALADAQMEIFNADGNPAEMCGNGLRCLIRYLIDQGLRKESITVSVGEKYYTARVQGEEVIVDMGTARILEEGRVVAGMDVYHIHTGVPHIVHFCSESDWKDFIRLAKGLRYHAHFSPSGVNVNFVKLSPSGLLQVRTYERGVEDETLSCGTGAAAVCVAAWKKYGMRGKLEIEFHSEERLQFDLLASDDLLKGICMRGHAMRVFEGDIKA